MKFFPLILIAAAAGFGLYYPFPFRLAPLPIRALLDSFHLPLFLGLTLTCRIYFKNASVPFLALCIFLVALLSEALQPFFGRSAEAQDVVFDSLGILLASLIPLRANRANTRQHVILASIAVLSMIAMISLPSLGYYHFKQNFPILSNFKARSYRYLWTFGQGGNFVMNCAQEKDALYCTPGPDEYSTMQLSPGLMNWSNYSTLRIRLKNLKNNFTMFVRIDDSLTCQRRNCRWLNEIQVPPGKQVVDLDLTAVSSLGGTTPLNTARVIRLVLFIEKEDRPVEFALEEIKLL